MKVKKLLQHDKAISIQYDPRLDVIDVTKCFPEKVAAANKYLATIEFPPKDHGK